MTECSHHHHVADRAGERRLLLALGVIVCFMIVEIVGGVISGSLALLADSAHMLTDAMALGLAASAQWMSRKPPNAKLHFGYRRAQVIAAFVNGVALIVLLLVIFGEAVQRFVNPGPVAWQPMLIVAVLGLAANVAAYLLLHGSDIRDNINVRGAMLHVVTDMLGSIAAIGGALIIMLTGFVRIDPILSVLVGLLIARSAIRLLRETSHILLEGAPSGLDVPALVDDLIKSAPSVDDIHHVQVSQITPDQPRLTMHARLRDGASANEALDALKRRLSEKFGIAESTIQIESDACCPDNSPSLARRNGAARFGFDASAHGDHEPDHSHGDRHRHQHHHGHGHAFGTHPAE
jgi:cobalt-zinc-cadmium efflux system protein